MPGSDHAKASGFDDNLDDAFTYCRGLSADNVPDANIRAYVENGARDAALAGGKLAGALRCGALSRLPCRKSGRFARWVPDASAARCSTASRWARTSAPCAIASPAASLFGFLNWTFAETYELLYRFKGWFTHLSLNMAKYWLDLPFRFTSGKDRRLTLGNTLVGGLRMALNERGVPLWLETPLVELISEAGKVTGALVSQRGTQLRIRARKGVVLAAGGFDKNMAMRAAETPLYPSGEYSGGVPSNTGDAIIAGQAAGAATMNLQSAWAAPVFYVPGEPGGRLSTMERALPGCIMVSQSGERFLNEAASPIMSPASAWPAARPNITMPRPAGWCSTTGSVTFTRWVRSIR